MKRVRHVPTIANRVGAGFALILFFMAVLIYIAYGDMRAAQAQADIDSNSLLFGVMAGGFMIVGIFLAIHLRNGLLWRSQTVADMIYTLSRGNPLEEYTQEQIENLNPPILNSLRSVSDQLVAAKKMQQEEVVLQETATERTAQMHRFRGAVEQVFSKAAHGDFSARLTVPKDRPELSDFCDRINSFLSGIDDSFQSIKTTMELIASGKLHTKIEGENEGDFHVLQENINGTLGMLLEFMTDLKSASHSVSDATSRISNGSSLLAQQVDQQASSLSEASSLMDGISQSISRSAESVTQADTLTSKAANQADHGSNVVSDAISAMERIEGNSDRISDIISVIEGIAFQTNLLALNAAVEAARAGDAGKGFAVVASEVRNLAQRASDAAKDITDLIQQSSGDVEDGVRLVKQSGDVLHEIADAVRQVSDTMSELNVSGANQARGVGEVTETIKALDTANAQSVVLADEASQGSQVLKEESKRLSELVKRFSSEESQDQEWENAVSDLRERSTPSEDSRDSKEPEMPMSLLGIAQKSNLATDVSSEWEEF